MSRRDKLRRIELIERRIDAPPPIPHNPYQELRARGPALEVLKHAAHDLQELHDFEALPEDGTLFGPVALSLICAVAYANGFDDVNVEPFVPSRLWYQDAVSVRVVREAHSTLAHALDLSPADLVANYRGVLERLRTGAQRRIANGEWNDTLPRFGMEGPCFV